MEEMRLIAAGNTAEVFALEGDRVCKLFRPGYAESSVEREFHNASVAWSLGIRSPRPHALVHIGGRDGIVYDRVTGEALSERYFRTRDDFWLTAFAELHKQLLHLETADVMDYRDFLRSFAGAAKELTEKIDRLPDGNRFLHGDYHGENVLVDEHGRLVLIDFMNVCRGPALYDVARTFFLIGPAFQRGYLERMGCTEAEIAPYLEVIALVRDREIGGRGSR